MFGSLKKRAGDEILLSAFLVICFFAVGLFHNNAVCFAGAALSVWLIAAVCKKSLTVSINIASVSVFAIAFFYLISCFWAVDGGSAFFGFLRYGAIAIFALAVMQSKEEAKAFSLKSFAYGAVVMTVVSAILMQFEGEKEIFSVAGRLSGFLQYPNTFALLLLCALLIFLTEDKILPYEYAMMAILLFGIFYSGSRIVFALTVVLGLGAVFMRPGKKIKIILSLSLVLAVAAVVVYGLLTDNLYNLARFLTIDLAESTFVGRLLYWQDALPLLLKYPFGMGYMGYYYMHRSIQTGVYYLTYVHNDFLQLALEIGIIPLLVFIAAIVKGFFRRGASKRNRFLILAICAHSFFDFDMQYAVVWFILLLCLSFDEGKPLKIKKGSAVTCTLASVFCILFIYFGIQQSLYYSGNSAAAYEMYNGDTQAALNLIANEENAEAATALCDKVLKKNDYSYFANSAKGSFCFSDGDVSSAMDYKRKALSLAPFEYDEYVQYCEILIYSYDTYRKMGDGNSAEHCKRELEQVVKLLENSEERLSELGKKIKDQPKTKLTGEIEYRVKEVLGNE